MICRRGTRLDPFSRRAERTRVHLGGADDLFEFQAIAQGGWVVPDRAKCAVGPGITRLDVVGCG